MVLLLALCTAAFLLNTGAFSSPPRTTAADQQVAPQALETDDTDRSLAAWAGWLWLSAWGLGGLGVGRFLSAQARLGGARPRPGLRVLAGVLGGFPTYGLLLLPTWARWVRRGPPPCLRSAWRPGAAQNTLARDRTSVPGSGSPFRVPLASQWLLAPWRLVGFLLAGLLANYLLLLALSAPDLKVSGEVVPTLVTLVPGLLRLAGFTLMTWYFFYERRRYGLPWWRSLLYFLLGALWWAPWPMAPMLALASYFLTDGSKHEESLARAALSGHGSASVWHGLKARLEGAAIGGSRRRMPGLGESDLRMRYLCWLRASALLPEAGLLGAGLSRLAANLETGGFGGFGLVLATARWVPFSLGALAALAAAGLFLASALGIKRGEKGPQPAPPYLPYLAWTQLFLWGGWTAGGALSEGKPAVAGAVLALLGLGGILVQVLPTLLSVVLPVPQPPATSEVRRVVAVLLFGGLFTYGLALMEGGLSLPSAGDLACALVLASLLGAVRLAEAVFLPFSPARLRDPHLTSLERIAFLALLVTVIAPLGGLAIPGWFYLRARLWSDLKRRLLEDPEPDALSPADGPVES